MNDKEARNILGINKDEELTEELIKKKYRNKALKYHPDKNKSKDSNDKFIISTVDEITLMISVEGSIDVDGERKRLNKELSNIKDEIEIIGKRLDNPEFVNKAPPKVVNEVKEKQGIYKKKKEEIEKALISL